MGRTALVLGGTGLVGSMLVSILEGMEEYSAIIVMGRRPLGQGGKKVREVIADMDFLKGYSDEFNVDDIYCCLGTTIKKAGSKDSFRKVDFDMPVEAAKLGSMKGAKNFLVISSMGADKNSAFFYSRVKGEMEEAVKQYSFNAIHIFRPSLLLGDRKEFRLGEKLAEWGSKPFSAILPESMKKSFPIPSATVARAMAKAALFDSGGVSIHESGEIRALGKKDS
ncbi:hypothetical protein [Bacillus sp. B-jedd]|uniref:hypothetical protein n=1 Tax=Bacillus sp. B-jedd TaxID=1476857 RepID=UPI0005156708|nr:hypothetical protein [Bacillus sp. B-jedd]CEG26622.1 NAD-dependent epimerase/dehydratase [Bacillus sp. B-jedd]